MNNASDRKLPQSDSMFNRAYFLVGPTAVGKTRVGIWLARRLGCEVLSADSMYVYRGMDIGTSKPLVPERCGVVHHGLDLANPNETFSVGKWCDAVRSVIRDRASRGVTLPLIVVGGTGLYVKSLIEGLSDLPEVPAEIRLHWRGVAAAEGLPALQEALKARAPEFYAALDDPQNERRLLRGLELVSCGVTHPPGEWSRRDGSQPLVTGLYMERDTLSGVIESRVHRMYAEGLLQEVQKILDCHGGLSETAQTAIGYAEALAVLRGEFDEKDAVAKTILRTRRLAKRQYTWFRHQLHVSWSEMSPDTTEAEVGENIVRQWTESEPMILAA